MISGNMRVGAFLEVECSINHTCPTDPPTLSLNVAIRSRSLSHRLVNFGTFTTTLKGLMQIQRDHQTVECYAQHLGGLTTKASKALNAICT